MRENQDRAARVFAEHRSTLIGVAYRVLGSRTDAEDVTQEVWLRWIRVHPADVVDVRAYLVRVVTRLVIDRLRVLKARRETHVGPWLPEPMPTGPDGAAAVETAASVSMALLVVLETLSPLERAVFVLREAFAFPYAEIGATLGRSETAVRQLATRARAHVAARRPRFDTDDGVRELATTRFLTACQSGDFAGLLALLAPEVTLIGDGGGRARAPRHPVSGAAKVARLLMSGRVPEPLSYRLATLNGGPAIVVASAGVPVAAMLLDLVDGLVQTINVVANPDKLGHLHAS